MNKTLFAIVTLALIGAASPVVALPSSQLAPPRSTCPKVGWALFIVGNHSERAIARAVPEHKSIQRCTHEFRGAFPRGEVSGTLVGVPVTSYQDGVAIARRVARTGEFGGILVMYMQ